MQCTFVVYLFVPMIRLIHTSWHLNSWIYNSESNTSGVRVMLFNVTFNNISVILWMSVLLMDGTGIPGENHRPVTSHLQFFLSHNVISSTPDHELESNRTLVATNTDCIRSRPRKSNIRINAIDIWTNIHLMSTLKAFISSTTLTLFTATK